MKKTVLITGHSSGLGKAIAHAMASEGWDVIGWSHGDESSDLDDDRITGYKVDVQWREEIEAAAALLPDKIDALINCAGINHLTPFEGLIGPDWEAVMDINAKAPWMITQVLLDRMASADAWQAGTVLNIVSNAAHMPMTHSLAYNASKAAALMVTKQMARELFKSHGLTVFSISPNKLAGTGMSRQIEEAVPALRGWTPEEAAAYQTAALPTGMETHPEVLAEFIRFLLSDKERHIYLHTCNIPYGG